MSDAEELVMHLANQWKLPGGFEHLTLNPHIAACRWRHRLSEFPEAVIPANAIVLVMRDAGSVRFQGRRREEASRHAGELGLMREGGDGRWEFDGAVDVFHFYLSNAALSRIAERENLGAFSEVRENLTLSDPVIATLAKEAAQACMEGEDGRLYADTLGLAMGLRLIRAHSNLPARPMAFQYRGGLAPWQVARVCGYIEDHLIEEIALETLAGLVELSPHHFCRAFKASTGSPPHRWQLEARVRRAETMMCETRSGLAEIALLCGFFDQSHFTRVFRRFRDVSPGRWRRAVVF